LSDNDSVDIASEIERILQLCRTIRPCDVSDLEIDAALVRRCYGDDRTRELFRRAGLLEASVLRARTCEMEFAKKFIRFAIDNLPDEDDVRQEFYSVNNFDSTHYFVPKRRLPQRGVAAA
jgi:hypothetical protein